MKKYTLEKDLKSFVRWMAINAKTKIKELALTELNNNEKKAKLDSYMTDIIVHNADYWMPKKPIVKFVLNYVINKFILPNISGFTQLIYDLLKTKIEGVTE